MKMISSARNNGREQTKIGSINIRVVPPAPQRFFCQRPMVMSVDCGAPQAAGKRYHSLRVFSPLSTNDWRWFLLQLLLDSTETNRFGLKWSQLLVRFYAFKAKAREQYLMRQCLNSSRMSVSESYVGKYTKQKLLGKGTFGEAWLVVSTVSGRWCLLM